MVEGVGMILTYRDIAGGEAKGVIASLH